MNYNYYSKEKHTNNQQNCTEQIMKNMRKIIINGFYTITIFTVLSMLIHYRWGGDTEDTKYRLTGII